MSDVVTHIFKMCQTWVAPQSTTPPKFWMGNVAPLKNLENMIKFVKTFVVNFPVWVDGTKTDATEPRIKVLFKEEREFNGLRKVVYGSAVTLATLNQAEVDAMWDTETDYAEHLKMLDVEGSDFGKVVPR